MKVFFEKREELAPAIWEYYFRPERPFSFVPGQYVTFHLPAVRYDPRGPARVFTLTSLPTDALLSFIVKFQDPISIYKQSLENIRKHDEAKIDDAMGDVILPKDPQVPLVFIAGGIGLASFASSIKWVTKRHEERALNLFYAVRHKSEVILSDLLEAYPFGFAKTTVVAPNRLQTKAVAAKITPNTLVYISGSEKFVDGIRSDLQKLGVTDQQIIFDFFDGYAEL